MNRQERRLEPTGSRGEAARIDGDVVLRRAEALGLDDRDLLAHVGLSRADLEHGLPACAVTLHLLGRLADLLDLEVTDLVTTMPPAAGPRRRTRQSGPTKDRWGDAATLLAVLLTIGPLSPDELSTALGWPHRRLTAATYDLTVDLADQPLALVEDDQTDGTLTITVQPTVIRAELRERLEATRLARDPLDPTEAQSLLRLVHGIGDPDDAREHRTDDWKRLTPDRRRGVHTSLARRGLAEPAPPRGPVTPPAPHPDVLFALDLAAEPAPVSPSAPPRSRRRRPPP